MMLSIWKGNIAPTRAQKFQLARQALADVAAAHGVTVRQILAYDPSLPMARIRQEAMWRARKLSGLETTLLAKIFHRDHSTISHNTAAYEKRLLRDKTAQTNLRV